MYGGRNNMSENREIKRVHTLNISKKITVSGVINVDSYDEKAIIIQLSDCMLYMNGSGFIVDTFSVEQGTLVIVGNLIELRYTKSKEKTSFIKRLLK